MQLTLAWYGSQEQAATLDTVSGEIKYRSFRTRRVEESPSALDPPHGCFGVLGGLKLALYRAPYGGAPLTFQFGLNSIAINEETTSEFRPDLDNENPTVLGRLRRRNFRLIFRGSPIFDHRYRAGHTLGRFLDALELPGPWPIEEKDYDFLYFVHRIIGDTERQRQMFQKQV